MQAPRAALPAAAALLLLAGTASADMLQTKDGRVVEGVKMVREGEFLVLRYANGDVRVPLGMLEDWFLEGTAAPSPVTEEEKAKRSQGLVPFRGKWVSTSERDRAIRREAEEKKKALAEYAKHSEWRNRYRFQTANFEFESTLPQDVNEEFSGLLETYFKEFGKIWKTRIPRGWGKLKVCFYTDQKEFLRTTGMPQGVLAYYNPVEPRELDFFYDRRNVALCVATLYHEANHYLTHLLNEKFRAPHWVNESMAEYYGASVWDPAKKAMVLGGLQEGRLAEVRSDMLTNKRIGLADLLSDTSRAYEHYNWGWSFVHFMMETPKHKPKFMKFFADLATAPDVQRKPSWLQGFVEIRDGRELLRVFLSRMGMKETDLDGLQKEWYAHVEGLDAGGVRGLEKGGVMAFMNGYWRFRAPRLLKEALDKGSRDVETHIVYALCLLRKKEGDANAAAAAVLEKAVALDPLDAGIRAYQGFLHAVSGNQVEGERLLALAKEMEPDRDLTQIEVYVKLSAEGVGIGGGD